MADFWAVVLNEAPSRVPSGLQTQMNLAHAVISNAIAPETRPILQAEITKQPRDPHALWEAIKSSFQRTGTAEINDIWIDFQSLDLAHSKSVHDFSAKLKAINGKLRAINPLYEIPAWIINLHFINGLGSGFDTWVTQVVSSDDNIVSVGENLTSLSALTKKAVEVETRQKTQEAAALKIAATTQSNLPSADELERARMVIQKLVCTKCNRRGHAANECRRCTNCDRQGHTADECRSKKSQGHDTNNAKKRRDRADTRSKRDRDNSESKKPKVESGDIDIAVVQTSDNMRYLPTNVVLPTRIMPADENESTIDIISSCEKYTRYAASNTTQAQAD